MTALQRPTRSTVVLGFACAWVFVLLLGIAGSRLPLSNQVMLHLICFVSGALAGSAVAVGSRFGGSSSWLTLMIASIGLYQHFRGEEGGLLLTAMFGGSTLGSWAVARLPKEPEPEDEPVERAWDED